MTMEKKLEIGMLLLILDLWEQILDIILARILDIILETIHLINHRISLNKK